ncbi:MAG: hypothetical protein ACFFCW_08540 [Candidatus Hodarchaeota archaeon]
MKKVTYYLTLAITMVMLIGFSIGIVEAKCLEAQAPDPLNFTSPGVNTYFPQALGITYVYMAETEDELILNEITITYDTEVIMGVTCTVVEDVEWVSVDDGITWILIEETDDWHAWDNDGNVWYFGEDTEEWVYDDDWNFLYTTDEGSWKAGEDGALPGIVMLANPMPGDCYQQEYYEGEAEDMGKVMKLNASVSIEYGDFDECLKTKEWTPLEPGEVEHKYYAPGLGLVFIEELKGKTVNFELIAVN